jgi:predicted RNA methylase
MKTLDQFLDWARNHPNIIPESIKVIKANDRRDRIREALRLDRYSDEKIDRYFDWIDEHPEIYKTFHKVTKDLISKNKKASAIDIFGYIRWNLNIEGGLDYKMNNNFAPMCSRTYIVLNPQDADFFEFREVGNERQAA